ncbi:MAG: hypothetical protein ACJ8G3_12070 [Burkholderiaceae bacterium]
MPTGIATGRKPSIPDVKSWFKEGYISKEQRNAYISGNEDNLKKADEAAEKTAIKESKKKLSPNPIGRTNKTMPNRVSNQNTPPGPKVNVRSRGSPPHKPQQPRATATQQQKAFNSIETTMQDKGFAIIKPHNLKKRNGNSVIFELLEAVSKRPSADHSKILRKYNKALSDAFDNGAKDNYELPDVQEKEEFLQITKILKQLEGESSNLTGIRIIVQIARPSGKLQALEIGSGKQEVHFAITPESRFQAFFKTPFNH